MADDCLNAAEPIIVSSCPYQGI